MRLRAPRRPVHGDPGAKAKAGGGGRRLMAPDATPTSSTITDESKLFAALAHGLALLVPFLPALVIWLVKKDADAFVAEHARQAMNFQLTVIIAYIVSAILILVLIGFVLMVIVAITALVFTIIALVKAAQGQAYRYPIAIPFFK
jgi:hypothetical protein